MYEAVTRQFIERQFTVRGILANCGSNTQRLVTSLRITYNNAYRILHYIPRNASVRPHQVNHCVRTCDVLQGRMQGGGVGG